MRPTSLAARKAGAALAVLMLSTALTACQPDGSTDAAAPTTAPTATDQVSTPAGNPTDSSTTSPADDSTGGGATGTTTPTAAGTSTDQTSTPTNGSTSNPTGGSQGDAPQGLESFYNQTITWEDCPDGASFKCGTVTVPVDYEHPDGQTITLALKKLPALDGDAEHGSLFLNPGGPGESGIRMVETGAPMFGEELRGAYDIIGFDPRGVGQSTPITCWSEDEIKQYLANPSSDTSNPTTPLKGVTSKNVAAQDKIDRGAANAARCAKHSQVPELLDHVGTRDVARDLDVLRATNGNARLNYLGVSYGTYIGAVYADLFPGRVGRTVLNGPMDPSKRETDGNAEAVAFKEGVLRQYVEHCQAQSACPLSGSTDEAVAQLAAFVDGLDKTPLTAPDSDATVNTREATAIIQQLAVAQPDWEALTAMLTPAMTNHDGTLMAKTKQNMHDLSPETTVEEVVSTANSEIMLAAVTCNDNPDTGGAASEWDAQAAAERKAHPFFGGISNAMEAYCHGWGHRGKTPPQETRAEGSAPILIVGTTGDSRTLYSWSQSLAGQLDNGHLFTVQGYGHGGAIGNCATTATIDFLVNGTVPADGATCTAEPKPTGADPQPAASGAEG